MVQEQINSVLFGVSYKKHLEFFDDEVFHVLVDHIAESDSQANILGDAYGEESASEVVDEGWLKRQKTFVDKPIADAEPNNRKFWMVKLKSFLTKSNEKWILDQFNLCKRFFLQNSIDGHFEDFMHPLFDKFHHIKTMRDKSKQKQTNNNADRLLYSYNNPLVSNYHTPKQDIDVPAENNMGELTKEIAVEDPPSVPVGYDDLEIKKCDISALLKAIEEIEKRIKMEKILEEHKEEKKDDEAENENAIKALRYQFSLLNFNRNFIALTYALKNPTDFREALKN
jgi:hypothetical protein